MPAAAVGLLLAAALAHATWNYLAKGARNDLAFMFATVAVSSFIYLPLALGVLAFGDPHIEPAGLAFIAVSATLHLTYYWLLTQGYRAGDLSLVYPLARGTGPVLAIIGAIILFDEQPTGIALAGAGLVVCGILVMAWPQRRDTGAGVGVSVAFAIATGACTAAYTLWDKQGVDRMTPLLYGYGLEVARFLYFAPFALRTAQARQSVLDTLTEQRTALLGIAALTPAAYILVLAALDIAPVSYVAPAREISILFGAALGLRLLGESDPMRRLAGAAAIVAGVFALALG